MRVVSLVPSLTLTLFDLGLDATSIVGRTPWCIHPSEHVKEVQVIGGTKTPSRSKIKAAQPDLVVMDRDENPKEIYDWCADEGIATYVCDVKHPEDVPAMLRELSSRVGCQSKGEELAIELENVLRGCVGTNTRGVVVPMIWHEPLMAAESGTYSAGVIEALGFNVPRFEENGTGYPIVSARSLIEHNVEGILLSSEPYDFALDEGVAIADAVVKRGGKRPWVTCIDGEALTWMGSFSARGILKLSEDLASFGQFS